MMKHINKRSTSSNGIARTGKGKLGKKLQANVPALISEAVLQKAWKFTKEIKFLEVGTDENGDRYLRWKAKDKLDHISVAEVLRKSTDTYVRLQRAGIILSESAAQREFQERLRLEGSKEPTFAVAIRPGLYKGRFFFPDDVASKPLSNAFYPDLRHAQIYRKFRRAGSPKGWGRLVALAEGNTRMILGLALAFSGVVCGAFGLDPPGVQFVGVGGVGKTPLARIIAAVWGWDADGSTRLGFGTSWKMKPGGLEVEAEAYNHTFMFLDEMSKATREQAEFVMTLAQGHGTARMTEIGRRIWSMALLSTSNRSLIDIMVSLGFEFDSAYVDRLMDIPAPADMQFVEELHGYADIASFFAAACSLAEMNHGYPGRVFAWKFAAALRKKKSLLKARFDKYCSEYLLAAAKIGSSWRDLDRAHNRFAVIYASGCLANEFDVLPISKPKLLAAILTCESDHASFVEQEVRRLRLAPQLAQPHFVSAKESAGKARAPRKKSPMALVEQHILSNLPEGLIDIRNPSTKLSASHDFKKAPGYIGRYNEETWILISNDRCAEVVGGKQNLKEAKKALRENNLIELWGRGGGKKGPTVRRRIANLGPQPVAAFKLSKAMRAKLPKLSATE